MPERKHYGEIPPDGIVPSIERPHEVVTISDAVLAWMRTLLGLVAPQVGPTALVLPNIQPVLEVYRPLLRLITVTAPRVGQGKTIVVPIGMMWEILVIDFVFTTSAAVANRLPYVEFDSPLGRLFVTGANNTQVASTTAEYHVSPLSVVGGLLVAPSNHFHMPVPSSLRLLGQKTVRDAPGVDGTILINANAQDANDAFTGIQLLVNESPAAFVA